MNWPDLENVHLYVLEGASFVEAFEAARAARSEEVASEGGFFNPARRAGLKLAFFEAVEQVPAPIDWYFQAVSSGMGVLGTWQGALELEAAGVLSRRPRLCCVQQASCAPMVAASREGAATIAPHHVVAQPRGPARAIRRSLRDLPEPAGDRLNLERRVRGGRRRRDRRCPEAGARGGRPERLRGCGLYDRSAAQAPPGGGGAPGRDPSCST